MVESHPAQRTEEKPAWCLLCVDPNFRVNEMGQPDAESIFALVTNYGQQFVFPFEEKL